MGKIRLIRNVIGMVSRLSSRGGGTRTVRGVVRGLAGSGSRASRRLAASSPTLLSRTAGRSARWLTRLGATFGLGWGLEAATRVTLESIFGDSTDQTGASIALQRVADCYVSEKPSNMKAAYDIASREGLWRYFEEGEPMVEDGEGDGGDGRTDPWGRSAAYRSATSRSCNGHSDVADTIRYFQSIYTTVSREVSGLLQNLQGSDPQTWLERETSSKHLAKLIISFGRMQSIINLLMDSVEQFTGYAYGPVFRTFSEAVSAIALRDGEILPSSPSEQLLRAIVRDQDVTIELDDARLKALATTNEYFSDITDSFLPLAF